MAGGPTGARACAGCVLRRHQSASVSVAVRSETERIDAEEDATYGKGQRGDELPKALQRRESRLQKIRGAGGRSESASAGQGSRGKSQARRAREQASRNRQEDVGQAADGA